MGVGTLGRHEFIVFAMIHSVGEGIKTRDSLFRSGGIKGETGDETCFPLARNKSVGMYRKARGKSPANENEVEGISFYVTY